MKFTKRIACLAIVAAMATAAAGCVNTDTAPAGFLPGGQGGGGS